MEHILLVHLIYWNIIFLHSSVRFGWIISYQTQESLGLVADDQDKLTWVYMEVFLG